MAGKAAAKTTPAKAKTAPKPRTARADPYKDKQGQEIGKGGTLEVPIIMEAVPDKGYAQRKVEAEKYPFSEIQPAKMVDGTLVGPAFFIPHYDDPDKLIATARKRHPEFQFISRKTEAEIDGKGKVEGRKVWRIEREMADA